MVRYRRISVEGRRDNSLFNIQAWFRLLFAYQPIGSVVLVIGLNTDVDGRHRRFIARNYTDY